MGYGDPFRGIYAACTDMTLCVIFFNIGIVLLCCEFYLMVHWEGSAACAAGFFC